MSDTPRTDAVLAAYFNPWPRLRDLARELERELKAANATMRQQQKVSDDLRKWIKTIPVVTDADKAELGEAITRLEAQQRGTSNAESMLCEMLEVDDGSQILDAIQGLKERIKRLEEAGDALTNCIACGCNDGGCRICRETEDNWTKAKEAKP